MISKAVWLGVCGCALVLVGCGGGGDDGGNGGGGANSSVGDPMMGGGTGATGGGMPGVPGGGMTSSGTGATSGGGGEGGMTTTNPMGGGMGAGSAGMDSGTGGVGSGMCGTAEDKRTGATCEDSATGIFAIKTVVDVWWQDDMVPAIVDAGRGKITVFLKGEISDVCPDGSGGTGKIKACGTILPPFKSDANCDAFQIEFPDELWDQPEMPTFTTTGTTTGFEPGDILTLATTTGLLGIEIDDPQGEWPKPAMTGMLTFPDHDGDSKPGITIRMGKLGDTFEGDMCTPFNNLPFIYRGAPLDALNALDDNAVKAETMQIGLRTRIGGAGAIGSDCASGVGASTAENLDSRVYDCQLADGKACTAAQSKFVDEQAPNYRILKQGEKPPDNVLMMGTFTPIDQMPSVGPQSSIVRLGDLGETVTCAQVRGAAFPAL